MNDLLFVKKMLWMDEREWQRWRACARRLNCDEVVQIWRLGGCQKLCRWVRGACIQCAHLSLASVETGGWEWCDWIWELWPDRTVVTYISSPRRLAPLTIGTRFVSARRTIEAYETSHYLYCIVGVNGPSYRWCWSQLPPVLLLLRQGVAKATSC